MPSSTRVNPRSVSSHLVIPDTQIKPNVQLDHMTWAGEYAAETKPTRIIHIGDGADMESLSLYDIGKKSFEGKTYRADIESFKDGMSMFMKPVRRAMAKSKWKPTFDYALGNHENRINRAIDLDRKLDGLISTDDLGIQAFGWTVHPFLKVFVREGVHYSHYFTSGVMGRPVSSARALLNKKHASCIMGHVQKTDIAFDHTASGNRLTGIFVGTYYMHQEAYRDPQSNAADYHCLWMLNRVRNGEFSHLMVPMDYLSERYG